MNFILQFPDLIGIINEIRHYILALILLLCNFEYIFLILTGMITKYNQYIEKNKI